MFFDWRLPFGTGGSVGTETEDAIVFTGEPQPVFCWPVWSDRPGASVYGGSWRTALPVGNALIQGAFSRSTNLLTSSTKMRFALGATVSVYAVTVPRSSCSANALYRVTLAAADADLSGAGLYRSSWLPALPVGHDATMGRRFSVPTIHLLDTPVNAAFAQIEWSDSGNADGYLDIYRPQIAGAYSPQRAVSVGAGIEVEDASDLVTTDANTDVAFARPLRRLWKFEINLQSESDAFLSMWRMQCELGKTSEFFFIFDRNDDPRVLWERSFLVRQEALSGVQWPYSTALKTGHALKEALV